MKPFVGLLFYLPILAVSHCYLFLESPTRLCSCAVVFYAVLPPNLVTVALHYFLSAYVPPHANLEPAPLAETEIPRLELERAAVCFNRYRTTGA
jgi:hypothetical protein